MGEGPASLRYAGTSRKGRWGPGVWMGRSSGRSVEAMIEGVLEADEFADQGVVAAVSLVALVGE